MRDPKERLLDILDAIAAIEQILSAFEEQAVSLYGKISANLRQSSALAAGRDALLPKLLSGEVRAQETV